MSTVVSRNVDDLSEATRLGLEQLVGSPLTPKQRVYVVIDVPEPGPNPVVKLGALGRIQRLVAEAQAHADRSGIPDSEIDAAVEEAMAHVRRRG